MRTGTKFDVTTHVVRLKLFRVFIHNNRVFRADIGIGTTKRPGIKD